MNAWRNVAPKNVLDDAGSDQRRDARLLAALHRESPRQPSTGLNAIHLKLDIDSGGLFGVETNIERQNAETKTVRSTIEAGGDVDIASRQGDITLGAPDISADGEIALRTPNGGVTIETRTDRTFQQDKKAEEDLFWWNSSDEGFSREVIEHTHIKAGGGIRIEAGDGIVVEYEAQANLDAAVAELSDP
ncbi:hemagglutinin repeat-containing protein [Notoacmeibacter ruber]|nr:hemagglutinin repeat-containing protein [Notoacmeibacter ruber]